MRDCAHDNPSVDYKLGPFCIHEEHGPMSGALGGFECEVCEYRTCGCGRAAVDGDTRCDRRVADDEVAVEAMKTRAA